MACCKRVKYTGKAKAAGSKAKSAANKATSHVNAKGGRKVSPVKGNNNRKIPPLPVPTKPVPKKRCTQCGKGPR